MGEVLRAEAQEPPEMEINRFHREFPSQIAVFVTELGEVALVERFLLVILRHGLQLQQSGLSHEDCLDLEEVVTMMGDGRERNLLGPLLEHIAIDAKAIVSGEGDEVGILPGAVALLHPSTDRLCLLFQPFGLERSHPGMYHQPRQFWDDLVARRIAVCLQQLVIVFPDMFRYIELHLFDKLAVGVHHLCIQHACHVENHIIVTRILVMAVQIPVTGFVMDLHVAHPQRPADLHLRIEEVGTCIVVVQAGVNHFDGFTVARRQFLEREQFVSEHIVQ